MSKINQENSIWMLLGLIALAYLFSFGVRLYWPIEMSKIPSMFWNAELMINTNDGYYFATSISDMIHGVSKESHGAKSVLEITPAFVYSTVFLYKILPISLETLLIYMPAIIASLVVIPIILTFRLFDHAYLGFLAALIGSIGFSYYNRTMAGYFDSDMFAISLMVFIFYAFLRIAFKKDMISIFLAAGLIAIYPYFYPQGLSLIYAMFFVMIGYFGVIHLGWLKDKETVVLPQESAFPFIALTMISLALIFSLPLWLKVFLFMIVAVIVWKIEVQKKYWLAVSLVAFVGFLIYGNVINILTTKLFSYIGRGVEVEGLHFYQVVQTVREAGQIPWSVVAERISGSVVGFVFALAGFAILVVRHKSFIIALPLIGIGLFSYYGGLRFTVYAVPMAAIGAVYLFWQIGFALKNTVLRYALVTVATIGMLYPNIRHVIDYKVPTVMTDQEVRDLDKLKEISKPEDYTIAWWDYGYPIWYYSNTNTIIDGGKHHNDNFIVSTILQTDSSQFAANFARAAVETYVSSDYKTIADTLFKNKQKDQLDPNVMLSEMELPSYNLPAKTRDIYIYMPYRMMSIFPTIALFGNLDLVTGKPLREMIFYSAGLQEQKDAMLVLSNGIIFDMQQGELLLGNQKERVKQFIMTQNTEDGQIHVQSQNYGLDGNFVVVFMKSYGQFVVMDTETFNSMYVQMFILGKYDSNLFELVVSSPYSRIYKFRM